MSWPLLKYKEAPWRNNYPISMSTACRTLFSATLIVTEAVDRSGKPHNGDILTSVLVNDSILNGLRDLYGTHSPRHLESTVRKDFEKVFELVKCANSWALEKAIGRFTLEEPEIRSCDEILLRFGFLFAGNAILDSFSF